MCVCIYIYICVYIHICLYSTCTWSWCLCCCTRTCCCRRWPRGSYVLHRERWFLSCERCVLSFVSVDGVFYPAHGVFFSPARCLFSCERCSGILAGIPEPENKGSIPGAGIEKKMFQICNTVINSGETWFKHRQRLHLYENLQKCDWHKGKGLIKLLWGLRGTLGYEANCVY